jgi:hypothetical protein
MSSQKKIKDLPKKAVSSKKSDTVKGGAKQVSGQSSVSSNMRMFQKTRPN